MTDTLPVAQFAGVPMMPAEEMAQDYGRWLIHGPQGSGKTTLASTIAEIGKTLFIDLTGEHGIRSFRGAPWGKNITVMRPASITALDDVFWELARGDHDFTCAVVDSLTAVQKMSMRWMLGHDETAVREIKRGVSPADQRTWGQTLDVMTDIATFWYGLANGKRERPMHIVFTAQSKNKENDDGLLTHTPDVQPGALSITLAAPDYVVYTDVEENPEHLSDDTQPPVRFIARFGADPNYRIKSRLPYTLRGKIPPILGRTNPLSLTQLSRVLGIGGVPRKKKETTQPEEKDKV